MTGKAPPDLRSLQGLQAALDRSPFQHFLGLQAKHLDLDNQRVELLLPFHSGLARENGSDQIHGGVLASLMDVAGDYALGIQLGYLVPTIDLRTDFLRPSHGMVYASASIVRCGRSIGVADIRAFDAGDKLVAVGRGTYSTRR